jgi:hypothetical protein
MNITVWFKGLIAAAIGGAASSAGLLLATPEQYMFTKGGLTRLGAVAASGAAIGVAGYLSKSPIKRN